MAKEATEADPDLKIQGGKQICETIEAIPETEKTYVVVLAIHKDNSKNVVQRIACKSGVPIGNYIKQIGYDGQSDTYHVECCDYFHLGYVPLSYTIRLPGSSWEVRIPMTEKVVDLFITDLQRRELANFKNHFKPEDHHIQYLQMIECN